MAIPLPPGSEIPINPSVDRWGLGLSWQTSPGLPVDLDLQAVLVNRRGMVVNAVYYNNLTALACVTHSGDMANRGTLTHREVIWLAPKNVPADVQMIVFVVAAYSGGHLRDAKNTNVLVYEEESSNELCIISVRGSMEDVCVVGMLLRTVSDDWSFHVIDAPRVEGQHFIDILEPTLGNLIREHIPEAPKRQKAAFAMEKGSVVDLSKADSQASLLACLGWDPTRGKAIDLDVSVVFLSESGEGISAVFFNNKQQFGVKHSGDSLTGEGEGDDEIISVNLAAVPDNVFQMFFVVNIYSRGVTFDAVRNAYCRILDSDQTELAKYILQEADGQCGLIIARLFREADHSRWGFQAVGTFCKGNNFQDSLPEIQQVFHKHPTQLQVADSTAPSLDQNALASGKRERTPSARPSLTNRPSVIADIPSRHDEHVLDDTEDQDPRPIVLCECKWR